MANKVKENLFGTFDEDSQEREQEQKQIEAAVTNKLQESVRPHKRGPNATTMSISISKEDKDEIKRQAAMRHMSVSDLIHYWIMRNKK